MTEIFIFNIAKLAIKSILNVAAVYPKPGLITPINNSALDGTDYPTLLDGTMALFQCFVNCASIGADTERLKPEDAFDILKSPAKIGEQDILRATKGRIKFSGHIFLMGLLCAAAGRLIAQKRNLTTGALALTASSYARGIVERELWGLDESNEKNALTSGQKAYILYGIDGCRGEADRGFQRTLESVELFKLLDDKLHGKITLREKCIHVLINIMCENPDTCLAAYGGITELLKVQSEAKEIMKLDGILSQQGTEMIFDFDKRIRSRDSSPRGSSVILTSALFTLELSKMKLTRSGLEE